MNGNETLVAQSAGEAQPSAASQPVAPSPAAEAQFTKFCSRCGQKIAKEAVVCPHCGCQVEQLSSGTATPNIVINNANTNTQTQNMIAGMMKKPKNKWVTVLLCFFLGALGAHKFYEGKIGMGILYLFTVGLLGIGVFIDFIMLLFKPNPYYV